MSSQRPSSNPANTKIAPPGTGASPLVQGITSKLLPNPPHSAIKYELVSVIPPNVSDDEKYIRDKIPGWEIEHDHLIGKGSFTVVYAAHDPRASKDGPHSAADGGQHQTKHAHKDNDDKKKDDDASVWWGKFAVKITRFDKVPDMYARKLKPEQLKLVYQIGKSTHPRIVRIDEMFVSKTAIYTIMPRQRNGNLIDIKRKWAEVTEQWARYWAFQIAEGIGFLHSRGIAHRNLKCENVLLTESLEIKLTGFSFSSKCVQHNRQAVMHRTLLGSLQYLSPEILERKPYDSRLADVWSFSVLLYILRAGKFPYDATEKEKLLSEQKAAKWRERAYAPSKSDPDESKSVLSSGMEDCLSHMLELQVEKRWGIFKLLNHPWLKSASQSDSNSRPDTNSPSD